MIKLIITLLVSLFVVVFAVKKKSGKRKPAATELSDSIKKDTLQILKAEADTIGACISPELLKLSDEGIALIKTFEGFRAKPYRLYGCNLVGYGSEVKGKELAECRKGVSKEKADKMLRHDVARFEKFVKSAVKKPITQHQFDALVSFTYNTGEGLFLSSTLLKKVNENPDDPAIRDEFLKWTKAGGKTNSGLLARRKKEADLYFKKG